MLPDHNPYLVFIKAYLLGLIFFSLSRLMLVVWQIDAVLATDQLMNKGNGTSFNNHQDDQADHNPIPYKVLIKRR